MRISDWSSDVCSSDLIGKQLSIRKVRQRTVVFYPYQATAVDPSDQAEWRCKKQPSRSGQRDRTHDAIFAVQCVQRRFGANVDQWAVIDDLPTVGDGFGALVHAAMRAQELGKASCRESRGQYG